MDDLAKGFDAGGLVHMMVLCESVQRTMKQSSAPRALFDALIVRLAMTEQAAEAAALLSGSSATGPPGKKA